MSKLQSVRNRIRIMNKHGINKLTIKGAGRTGSPFSILYHTGRKSGTQYAIPIILEPKDNGFVIALTYGREVDWLKNILHAGVCKIRYKNQDYILEKPVFISQTEALQAFSWFPRRILPVMRINDFLFLKRPAL